MQPGHASVSLAVLAALFLGGCAQGPGSLPAEQPSSAALTAAPDSAAPAAPDSVGPAAADPVAPAAADATPEPTVGASAGIAVGPVPVRPADAAWEPRDPSPVALDIAGTDISVRVLDVGIDDKNAMEIPDSFWEAGWYRYGPAPGAETGNAVIAAHVDSLTEVMPFAQLKDVSIGTIVTVGLEDGRSLTYRVSDVRNVPKATLNGSEIFKRDGDHQLKIITCGGDWLPEEGDYEDNVVLTALPL
ncbi:hypothetical protein RCH21_000795 [Arthrobacter sp. PL16]|uniref:class F sortase n=1 Tax=Arthrobacter sp. PL16 TaxID=3071720 RepID=UPI002E0C4329|nr:hypothetical protein [Arthrobacter sp. PL16]